MFETHRDDLREALRRELYVEGPDVLVYLLRRRRSHQGSRDERPDGLVSCDATF